MKRLFLFSIIIFLGLSSCRYVSGKRVTGNGVIKSEPRQTGSFNHIEVRGSFDVYLKQDSVSAAWIETDENLMEYIEIVNEGDRLIIRPRNNTNLKPTRKIRVSLSSPAYRNLTASGASNIYGENKITEPASMDIHLSGASAVKLELATPTLSVEASGAGTISLKGETRDFKVQGTGSTNINCFELMAENVNIRLTGAGDAEVFASVKLDIRVSGAAEVKYKGNPSISQSISGAGSVKKAD